jgi:hypothetical protein
MVRHHAAGRFESSGRRDAAAPSDLPGALTIGLGHLDPPRSSWRTSTRPHLAAPDASEADGRRRRPCVWRICPNLTGCLTSVQFSGEKMECLSAKEPRMANQKVNEGDIELIGGPWDGEWEPDIGAGQIEHPCNGVMLEQYGKKIDALTAEGRDIIRRIEEANNNVLWAVYNPTFHNGKRVYKFAGFRKDGDQR